MLMNISTKYVKLISKLSKFDFAKPRSSCKRLVLLDVTLEYCLGKIYLSNRSMKYYYAGNMKRCPCLCFPILYKNNESNMTYHILFYFSPRQSFWS